MLRLKNRYGYTIEDEYIKIGIEENGTIVPLDKEQIELDLRKLINRTNMILMSDGFIKMWFENIYDLYYEKEIVEKLNEQNEIINIVYQEKIDTYRSFQLPDIFDGYIRVQNNGNFAVSERVIFEIEFWQSRSQLFHTNIYENIVEFGNKRYLIQEETYKLISKLVKYNRSTELSRDQYEQYSTLKAIKDALSSSDFFINKRLSMTEDPVLVDEIDLVANVEDEGIFILPQVLDDEEEQKQFGEAFDKNRANNIYRIGNKKVIFKNKYLIRKVHEHKNMEKREFKSLIDGEHELNFYDDISLEGLFSPRVTGVGFIELNKSVKTNPSGLNWFDGEFSNYPMILEDKEGETYTLSMNDVDELESLIQEDGEVVTFSRLIGNDSREFIATKDEVKELIDKLKGSEIFVNDIKSMKLLEELECLVDRKRDGEYIEVQGLSVKNTDGLEDEIRFQKEKVKKEISQESKKRTMGLEIFENDLENDYKEDGAYGESQKDIQLPEMIKDGIKLFPHQREGVNRMVSLYQNNDRNGVLLADDMGLGKTLQIITLMAWIKENTGRTNFLIVAPKILLNNWINEIDIFVKTNGLSIAEPIKGRIARDKIDMEIKLENLKKFDVVLTTYTSLKINQIALGKIHWTMMVCDEIQRAKNPKTQVGYAIKTQNADFKIACTATPIENTTEDLWNIMDFSRPGLLGSLKDFRSAYVQKVDQLGEDDDKDNQSRFVIEKEIKEVLEPFVIRRQKKDILADRLPKKNIIVDYIAPTALEKNYIQEVYDLMTMGESPLAAVGHLVRICAHPNLYKKDRNLPLSKIISNSSKMMWMKRVLAEVKSRDEKVLIFADIYLLQNYIIDYISDEYGFVPSVINGKISDKKRTKILNEFGNSTGFNCLILSTEVAGVGLTITEANNVIHYMRKWNPAKENQATDRVYRIGQNKDVNVYLPIISFSQQKRESFVGMDSYISAYENAGTKGGSPDEKLNSLLVKKNKLLSDFFYAVNEKDMNVSFDEFLAEESSSAGTELSLQKVQQMDKFDFTQMIASIYERQGYQVQLIDPSSKSAIDLIGIKDDKVVLAWCHGNAFEPVTSDDYYRLCQEIENIKKNYAQIEIGSFDIWSMGGKLDKKIRKTISKDDTVNYFDEKAIRKAIKTYNISYEDIDSVRKEMKNLQPAISEYYELV